MHQYLRAIGFSSITSKKQLNSLLDDVINHADEKNYVEIDQESVLVEYVKEYANSMGIVVRGEFDDAEQFSLDFYYPICRGVHISTEEDIAIERHAEKESYAGACDDIKIGVSLIFYLQNTIDYLKNRKINKRNKYNSDVIFTGLSIQGKIMLPINKNEKDKNRIKKASKNRYHLLAAARRGDEDAIESLTLEDIDTYTTISRKILKEDVFTLVDSYFMPYGVECDQYSVLGEIEDVETVVNKYTNEKVYLITLNCNEILLDISINKKDLLGEPMVGRRFKGVLWMQGKVDFNV
ncbi:MAG: DUF3881 family protein [Clostridia bacterium]|nr:DUF3881 family protein [Clostridia bacterium]